MDSKMLKRAVNEGILTLPDNKMLYKASMVKKNIEGRHIEQCNKIAVPEIHKDIYGDDIIHQFGRGLFSKWF